MYRKLLPLIALGQFAAPLLPTVFGIGTSVGDAARADYNGLPPEQPVGIAFAIWGVIFSLYAAFAIFAFVRETELVRRVGPPLALAGALNVLWMLSAQLIASQLLNTLLLFPIAWLAWRAAWQFDQMRGLGGDASKLVADATTGLLSGWITVAVAISAPLTVRTLTGLGASDAPWQMLFLTLAVAAGGAYAFASRVSRSLWYFVALGWGVACIALNNWFVTGMNPMAVIAGLAGAVIVWTRLSRAATGSAV